MKKHKSETFTGIAKISTINIKKGWEYELVPEIASVNHNGKYQMRVAVYIGETFIQNIYTNEELTETFDIKNIF